MSQVNYARWGAGEPVVLIHGVGSRWQVWLPVLNRLAAQREVIAIDLPGFGASPRPAAAVAPGIATLLGLVTGFLDELGLARPHVVGNSLGGRLALELAARGRAASATALSPVGFDLPRERSFQITSLLGTFHFARALGPLTGALTATRPGRLGLAQYFGKPWRIPAARAAEELRGLAGATWFPETVQSMFDDTFSATRLEVPATVAWGNLDRLLLPRQAARAARQLPGARSVTLHGCGHVPTYDDPAQVARVILEGTSSVSRVAT